MPEGPDIYLLSQYLNYMLQHKYIDGNIHVLTGKYIKKKIIGIEKINNETFYKIKHIKSKGKVLYIKLSSKLYIYITFGLTGKLTFDTENNIRAYFNIYNNNKIFEKKLYYVDNVNFGNMYIYNKFEFNNLINNLGRDFIKHPYTNDEMYNHINNYIKLRKNNGNNIILKYLLEQHKNKSLGSGIGNYLVSEILYHAKLSPYRTLASLSQNDIYFLNNSIQYILKLSYFFNNTYNNIPADIKNKILSYNILPDIKLLQNEFTFKVYNNILDPYGNIVLHDKIIKNRITYWCNLLQL